MTVGDTGSIAKTILNDQRPVFDIGAWLSFIILILKLEDNWIIKHVHPHVYSTLRIVIVFILVKNPEINISVFNWTCWKIISALNMVLLSLFKYNYLVNGCYSSMKLLVLSTSHSFIIIYHTVCEFCFLLLL